MKGFLRMAIIDFNAWNSAATVLANENGLDCDIYTTYKPDIDPNYVWARVEHSFIEGNIVSLEDAIIQGMNPIS